MQFHLNGFRTGDPDLSPAAKPEPQSDRLPDQVDVLIVGCGPAGLTLAAQLAGFPEISTRIVEQKPGPLELGQADGIACRTMEMFQAFGFVERVLREAYWVSETTFWRPNPDRPGDIHRSGRIQDVEDGLSEFPHVILNQARVHEFYLDIMRKSPSRLTPDYSRRVVDLSVDRDAPVEDPGVTVTLERTDPGHEGETETVRARYVVGCDGARSSVRKALGRELKGDSQNQAWGVMDVLAESDFPDFRLKSLIQSASEGNIVQIPREGGYLVRLYIELDKLKAGERVSTRTITSDHLIAAAQRILHPHTLDVKEIAWWSVYEIGQRLTDKFDDVEDGDDRLPRVFICGDACHTHSPKAGLGMNVSMQDAFNLGWKLSAVLRGLAGPDLLATYSEERQAIAKELIDFDREWVSVLSADDPEKTQDYFVRHGRYTAGTATLYHPSRLTAAAPHQELATGFKVGTRFHSAPVIRLGDAKPMELGHAVTADARFRIFAFADAGDPTAEDSQIRKLCAFLSDDPTSPLKRHTPAGGDIDSVIDVRAVFQDYHRHLDFEAMPELLKPIKGRLGLKDYEKMFCAVFRRGDVFDLRGVDRKKGCLVVVRPDQYIGAVLPLDGTADLAAYFEAILKTQ